ncbi:hypothetical protein C0Q70_05408 [Pomacea canaliculata]|uniref:Uncharacterized protein n=2 Tax=Pomacea canaliculata TaxID=400727 RepID=A0A2T7PL36_POMCA|nr:hypothetical protein C0Q70_05408 [Pomacea canaliculata]
MEDTQENTKSVPSEVKGDGSELLCSVDSETPTHELERMSSSSLCKKDQPDEDLEKRLLSPLEENPVVLEDTTGNLTEQLCEEQGETSKIVKKNALLLACPLPPPGTPSCSSSREGREGSSRFAGSSEGVRYFQNFVPKRNPNSALPNTQFIEFKTSSPES